MLYKDFRRRIMATLILSSAVPVLGFLGLAFVQLISLHSDLIAVRARNCERKASDMHLTLEFGGGLELLFGSQKKHEVEVAPPDGLKELTMESLLSWIKENLLKERPEMFLKENSVRPGVLVLVNDSDWELCGRLETVLEDNDEVIFISTLHGG